MNISKTKIVNLFAAVSVFIYLIYFLGSNIGYFENQLIFFDREDRFADIFKLIYSFSNIFSDQDFLNLDVPHNLIGSEKNPYAVIQSNGGLLNMSLPPLTIILVVATANLAKLIGFHYSLVYIIYLAFLATLLLRFYSSNLRENLTLVFILFSFPLLFLIERGNIWAAFSGCCLLMVFKSFVYKQELSSLDLFYFIIASSIRPNYLIFGLLFLTDRTLKSLVLKFVKVGVYFAISNSLFLFIAMKLYPGYDLGYFFYFIDQYSYSDIRFTPWNSSLHGFIHNIYSIYLDSNYLRPSKNIIQRLEEIVTGQAISNLILIIYLSILMAAFLQFKLKKMSNISFLTTGCCVTALATSPFADYHLIIFIFLFFLIYDRYENDSKHAIQLIMISLILLPKLHAWSPDINIHSIINVLSLNILLFTSFVKLSKKS